jgi:hypothetical protein
MNVNDLLTKKPFYRLQNSGLSTKQEKTGNVASLRYLEKPQVGMLMTQTDFLEEYYPSAHKINSEFFFPESYNYGEVITEDGEKMETMYREETFRVSVPLQKVVALQHLVHLYGNDIHHELADNKVSNELNDQFMRFQMGWLQKNIDIAIYDAGRSEEITADKAIVFYMYNKKCYTKVLSFLNGDTLYPHYDMVTGRMNMFARKFSSYDEENKVVAIWVEVWDNKYLYRYKQSQVGLKGVANKAKKALGLDAFELVSEQEHGFPELPVAYGRAKDNGPGWNDVQYLADEIEVALSYWAKACASTANDAYIMKGDNVDIKGDPLGRVRAFTMGKDDSVELLEKKTGGDFFKSYVERLYKEFFRGSFTVETPELKSGDTPASTIKLIYAPNLDLAMTQAKDQQDFINQVRHLFCIGYGIELGKISELERLEEHILSYIVPFVHEDTAGKVANLVALKNAGLISTETGVEQNPYCTNAEADKIFREQKQEQAADRLYQLRTGATAE